MADSSGSDVQVLVTNRRGAYALLAPKPSSRWEGVFFRDGVRMIKVIESLMFQEPISGITNKVWCVSLQRGDLAQTLFMPLNHDAVVLELNKPAEFELFLDGRIAEDDRVWGRNYEVVSDNHTLVVKFSKKTDARDDNAQQSAEFEWYLAVYSEGLEYLPLQDWVERLYETDKKRNSPPFSRWVFRACRIRAQNVVFGFGVKKEDAVTLARQVFEERERLKREREWQVHERIVKSPKIADKEVVLAYQCSVNALDSLIVEDGFVRAGLPWFYQRWARDELISVKAWMIQKQFGVVKKILFEYLDKITREGVVSAIIDRDESLFSADAAGWLFFRLYELSVAVARSKCAFSKKEKQDVAEKLTSTLDAVFKSRCVDGLIVVNHNETWMDAEFGNDCRLGAPIEVQALILSLFKILRKLTGRNDGREFDLVKNVRKNFLKGKFLVDVAGQNVIRPNVFIAAYVYPELLSKKEWHDCFEAVLPRLWLDWGGLSSIDKKHVLFCEEYTGQDNKSYHRGDSWFWMNNLAAIVLSRMGGKKFASYVEKILGASTHDILYQGATGFASELSSAKELRGEGCVAQAWSAATFVELVDELFGNK